MNSTIIKALLKNNIITKEQLPIYEYGFRVMRQSIICLTIMILVAVITDTVGVLLAFTAAYFPLRRYAGGYHQNTRLKCFLMSEGIYIFVALMSGYILKIKGWQTVVPFILTALFLIVYLKAPVDNVNRRISDEQRKRYRRYSFIVCVLETIAVIILLILESSMALYGMLAGIITEEVLLLINADNYA